ncbi:MAG: glycosyltransferase [Alphaproteobacteria bacterium]|nr:glycosyltransferase [Alphaproteobacteria bacterium]
MRCLWITFADPEPPHSGQFVYTAGLIRSFADAGAELHVLALSERNSYRRSGLREGRVTWWLGGERRMPQWSSLGSRLPNIANRCRTPTMQRMLQERLDQHDWDAIVFDGLSAVWALEPVLRRYPDPARRPRIVHVSHNHEASTRTLLPDSQSSFLKRQALRWDNVKIALTERALVRASDLVTAITPEDSDAYRREWPEKPIEVLTPGYQGRAVDSRLITDRAPRRAVIVGTFDWIAKRINMEQFIRAADALFAQRGIQLQIIGSGDPGFIRSMQERVRATEFTGTVDRVETYLDEARVAIVPEQIGGGFKLKILDYVFNRIPILALHGSAAGVPLKNNESILFFSGHDELAGGVMRTIDELDRLNHLHDAAYSACRDQFDWSSRGQRLATALGSL